jgi:hypothetical protein
VRDQTLGSLGKGMLQVVRGLLLPLVRYTGLAQDVVEFEGRVDYSVFGVCS